MQRSLIILALSVLLTACGGNDNKSRSGGGGADVERFAGQYPGIMGRAGEVIEFTFNIDTRGRIEPIGLLPGCSYNQLSGYPVNNKGRFSFNEEYRCVGGRFAGCSRIGISATGKIGNSGSLTAHGSMRGVCSGRNINRNEPIEFRAQRQ